MLALPTSAPIGQCGQRTSALSEPAVTAAVHKPSVRAVPDIGGPVLKTKQLPAPLSTTPEAVAADVLAGLRRGAHTVWSPGPLRWPTTPGPGPSTT